MTHSYVCHDSFICVPWLIHMCDTTHSYVWHDSFICVTYLVWCASFICMTCHMCTTENAPSASGKSVVWLIHMCDMTHVHNKEWTCGKGKRPPVDFANRSNSSSVTAVSHGTYFSYWLGFLLLDMECENWHTHMYIHTPTHTHTYTHTHVYTRTLH